MATFTVAQRKVLAKSGVAMPDGSFPVRNAGDLDSAKHLAKTPEQRKHVMSRAKVLGLSDDIPSSWNPDGSLNHAAIGEEYLEHFGRKGMKWGEHIFGKAKGPSSEDHNKAQATKTKVKESGGIHSLSNSELKELNKRLNLEKEYTRLTSDDVGSGKSIVEKMLKDAAKQQGQVYVNQGTKALSEWLVTEGTKKIASARNK